jgi:hypothetical protein
VVKTYKENHCWQYDIRLKNAERDLRSSGLTEEEVRALKCSDFVLKNEAKSEVLPEVRLFIETHEWLGKLSLYPTHFFTARYKGILAGVVVMDMPTAFSKLLGEDTKKVERLISRGACISWSPKNLASKLISYSIKWMVKNTPYRLFTAYSDVEAKELGTIYQACNFYYLGKKSGTKAQFKIREGKWVSDRYFRSRSVYKKLARESGIVWESNWSTGDKVHFCRMPKDVSDKLKRLSKEYQKSCQSRIVEPKHKYAFLLGRSKKETKKLRDAFEARNKTYQYPKNRGE